MPYTKKAPATLAVRKAQHICVGGGEGGDRIRGHSKTGFVVK
jgi:hypothetical protein